MNKPRALCLTLMISAMPAMATPGKVNAAGRHAFKKEGAHCHAERPRGSGGSDGTRGSRDQRLNVSAKTQSMPAPAAAIRAEFSRLALSWAGLKTDEKINPAVSVGERARRGDWFRWGFPLFRYEGAGQAHVVILPEKRCSAGLDASAECSTDFLRPFAASELTAVSEPTVKPVSDLLN